MTTEGVVPNENHEQTITEIITTDVVVASDNPTTSSSSVRSISGPISLTDFELGVTLGTGSFGRVRFATHKATKSVWAIKMLKKSEVVRLQQVEHMISEKNILSGLDNPFIVRLSATFQDPKYLYMVLEYIIGGEFFTHLRCVHEFIINVRNIFFVYSNICF